MARIHHEEEGPREAPLPPPAAAVEVQRLSKEIASTKQSLKRLRRAVSNLFLRARQITIVLAVYMLSEYDIGVVKFLQWVSWLRSRVPAGKQAVFINVDETSISLARPDLKGNIVPGKCSLQQKGKRTRGALTHVASICNRSDIQPCLPQVILSNTRVVSQKLAKSLLPLQPETVRLVRGKTGWSTAASFVEYLKMLRDALSLWPEIQPILVMDCAPAHLADSVIEAANNQGFFTAVCPAGLTPLLQPLDVYCFQGYKHYLAEKTRDAVDLSMSSLSSRMQILFGACTTYLSRRSWKSAFGRLQLTQMSKRLCLGACRMYFLPVCQRWTRRCPPMKILRTFSRLVNGFVFHFAREDCDFVCRPLLVLCVFHCQFAYFRIVLYESPADGTNLLKDLVSKAQ
ncbi:unnamed protein product [Symbiodinium sp. CCMP2592]|nr:unnamed protein product [Symbiodinium sp. CCMP2592]